MPELTTVTLPANLTSIPKDAFAGSAKLATVKFGTADANNGGGGNQRATTPTGEDNAITLPSGITSIGNNAFAGTAATTVDLSKVTGLATIGDNVFKGMASLTTVTLPSTVTSIGQNAFQGDAKLATLMQPNPKAARADEATTPTATTAKFGKSLTSIRDNAFYGTGFTTVDLSEAGTAGAAGGTTSTPSLTVGSNAFTNMMNLTTVTLPANADINPTYFGNPTPAEGTPKLNSITYGKTGSTSSSSATATLGDATISSTNFSKIKNKTIEIKSSVSQSTINFTGGVFNGNADLTTLKLSLAANTRNGNNPL